jgi:hypothetical protein
MIHAVETGLNVMIYVSSLIKIDSDIQKLVGGGWGVHRHTDSTMISLAYFYFFKTRIISQKDTINIFQLFPK